MNEAPVLHYLLYVSILPLEQLKGFPRDSTLRKYIKATKSKEEAEAWRMNPNRNYETHRDDEWKHLCSVSCTKSNINRIGLEIGP